MVLTVFWYFAIVILSLVGLWKAGDLSIKYSNDLAKKFEISSMFIGFFLLAVATGLPELAIAISALRRGVIGISSGTILGSNVSDISLVLGLAILIHGPIHINVKENRNLLKMLLISALSMAVVFWVGFLTKCIGIILILIYTLSILWLWKTRKDGLKKEKKDDNLECGEEFTFLSKYIFGKTKLGITLGMFFGFFLILVTSEIVVHFSVKLVKMLSLSLEFVGTTIFAIGTSLPELSLSLNAVKKKEYVLALGNSFGSVLEQGTLIIGILAFASSKPIDIVSLRGLVPFMFLPFIIIGFGMIKNRRIGRIHASLMVIIYIIFLMYESYYAKV